MRRAAGVPVVTRDAQCATVLRVIGIGTGGDQFTPGPRVVVGNLRRSAALAAYPVVTLEDAEAETILMFATVAALVGIASHAIELPTRLRQAGSAFAVLYDLATAPARRRRFSRHGWPTSGDDERVGRGRSERPR